MFKRQQIIDALMTVLTDNLGAVYDQIIYWQDGNTEYKKDYLILRDGEEDHAAVNRVHQQTLHCEIEAVVFAEDAPRAGTNALGNLIRVLGENRTLGGLAQDFRLVRNSKEITTSGKRACQILLEFDVIYRTELFVY